RHVTAITGPAHWRGWPAMCFRLAERTAPCAERVAVRRSGLEACSGDHRYLDAASAGGVPRGPGVRPAAPLGPPPARHHGMGPGMTEQTTPDDITAAVLASFARSQDERLGTVMRSLTAHLHAFVKDVALTEEEWHAAIRVLTATGHITSGKRREWILWSDALGVSMLVDALANRAPAIGGGPGEDGGPAGAATSATVPGPVDAAGAPQ